MTTSGASSLPGSTGSASLQIRLPDNSTAVINLDVTTVNEGPPGRRVPNWLLASFYAGLFIAALLVAVPVTVIDISTSRKIAGALALLALVRVVFEALKLSTDWSSFTPKQKSFVEASNLGVNVVALLVALFAAIFG